MSNTTNIFENAVRRKLRFQTTKGSLSVEDLFDLNLTSLDNLAKGINKSLKETEEESFIPSATTANRGNVELRLKLDILKSVIGTQVEEQNAAKARADKRAQIERLKALAANKQDEALNAKSLEDIQKMLADLGEE